MMKLNDSYPVIKIENFKPYFCYEDVDGLVKSPIGTYNLMYYWVEFASVDVTFNVERLFLPNKRITKNVIIYRIKLGEDSSVLSWNLLDNGSILHTTIDYEHATPTTINELREWQSVVDLYNSGEFI